VSEVSEQETGFTIRTGHVDRFDERHGVGEIVDDDRHRYTFHSTQIDDGTRRVAVGARVEFEVRPAARGRWEAASIRPAPDSG
jgi:cold shock CspA family protein